MTHRLLSLLAFATLVTTGACADFAQDEEVSDTGEQAEALTTPCSIRRAEILASVAGERREALERGFRWLDRGISYSQTRSFEGYRTDCSGFISMCWQLGQNYTTANFTQGTAPTDNLASYDELLPGDAIVRRSRGEGHIVLFLGWNDAGRTSACVLEQSSTRLDMEFGARTRDSLDDSGYRPIRAEKF